MKTICKYRRTIALICNPLFIGVLILFSLTGCGSKGAQQSDFITITDMLEREVQIPKNINKVVGIRAGALRLLVYMNLTEKVSGVEDVELRDGRPYAMAHPQLSQKQVIGPMMSGDAELITVNNPDVIFMTYTTTGEANDLQKKTGIPVITLKTGNLTNQRDDFNDALTLIGHVTNKSERAGSLIRFIDKEIETLNKLTQQIELKPRVYIGGVSYSGARGIASTIPIFDAFEFINAHNVAKPLANSPAASSITGTTIDIEQLIVWNPDYLFIDASGIALVTPQIAGGTPMANTLSAIQNDNIFTLMPYNWYATNYETILVNSWYIASILYPDMVSHDKFINKTETIYDVFLKSNITNEMTQYYQGWKKWSDIKTSN